MKNRVLLILTLGVFVASMGTGQSVVGSKHDLSSGGPNATLRASNVDGVCVFCHTPHQATAASAQDPLWNHDFPAATPTYGVYASNTLDADMTSAEIGQAIGSASASMLCMSCHDGTVAVGALYNDPNDPAGGEITPSNSATMITGNPVLGNHTDDHPLNFTYNAALATTDGELNTPNSVDWVDAGNTVPLFGGTVQCASCHDPHDPTNAPFLVKDNTASALCITCHIK